jgi:hypothetical protein
MSELQQYYDLFCRTNRWAHPDSEYACGCRGRGWWLSEVDTWHKCPYHEPNAPHPEDYEAIRGARMITVTDEDTGDVVDTCTLTNFFAANDFDDKTREDCERALLDVGVWRTGGGAAPAFRVEVQS